VIAGQLARREPGGLCGGDVRLEAERDRRRMVGDLTDEQERADGDERGRAQQDVAEAADARVGLVSGGISPLEGADELGPLDLRVGVRELLHLDALRVRGRQAGLHAGQHGGHECVHLVLGGELGEEDAGGVQAAVGLLDRGPRHESTGL